ncbi:unnamed protein product [Auanema sp. JU1783]|nr:unnamed protein product [Auanema sp. JU1783]
MVENSKSAIGKRKILSSYNSDAKTRGRSELVGELNKDLEGYRRAIDLESSDTSDSSEDEDFDYEIFAYAKELTMKTYTPIYKKYIDDNAKYYRSEFQQHIRQFMPRKYRTYNNLSTSVDLLVPHRLKRFDTVCVPESPDNDMFPCLVQMFPSSTMCPRMRYYVHVDRNIQTDDTLRLSNFPQLESSEDVDRFHQELRKAYPEGIHGERRGWGLLITDELLYLLVQEVLKQWTTTNYPTSYIFKAIYKLFPTKLITGELEDSYPTLVRRFEKEPNMKKNTKSVKEVDHSISSLYCGKCNQFFCELHALDGTEKVAINKDYMASDDEDVEACGPECYMTEQNGDVEQNMEDNDCELKLDALFNEEASQKLLELLLNLKKFSSCCLSKVLSKYDSNREWTCREIFVINQALERHKASLSPEESKERKKMMKDLPTGHKSLARMTNGEINNSAKLKPCAHEGACTDCVCSQENTPCTKFCKCSEDCRKKLRGCVCLPGQCGTNLCPCYLAKWECDSDNCKNCICGSSKFTLPSLDLYPTPDPELNYYGVSDSEEDHNFLGASKRQNYKKQSSDLESLMSTESTGTHSVSTIGNSSEADERFGNVFPLSICNRENMDVYIDATEGVGGAAQKCRVGDDFLDLNARESSLSLTEQVIGPKSENQEKAVTGTKITSYNEDHNDCLPSFFSCELTQGVEGWLSSLSAPNKFDNIQGNNRSNSIIERALPTKVEQTDLRSLNKEQQTDIRLKRRKQYRFLSIQAYKRQQEKVLASVFGSEILKKSEVGRPYGNEQEEDRCNNCRIQNGQFKRLKVGVSSVAGFGCFLCEPASKGDLVAEYTGEVISRWEAERRGLIYDEFKCSFIFALNNAQSVDATRMGNTIRFANHSDNGNCYSQIIVVNGEHRIGIFAKRDLPSGEEIFFDYQYNKNCKEKYVPKDSKDV